MGRACRRNRIAKLSACPSAILRRSCSSEYFSSEAGDKSLEESGWVITGKRRLCAKSKFLIARGKPSLKYITLIEFRLIVLFSLLIDACEERSHASSLARLFSG